MQGRKQEREQKEDVDFSLLAKMSDCNISYYMPVRKTARYFNITLQAPVVTILEILGNKLYRLAPERQELLSE